MADTDNTVEPAPWCKDALFVLSISGDGQGTSLHWGWNAIRDAVIRANYFRHDLEETAEIIERFTDFEDWEYVGGFPWRWAALYEDGSVTVERVTDRNTDRTHDAITALGNWSTKLSEGEP